ncbi:hypothetical protein MJG53_018588 [Ovis ammon polii x Ovis aries]|nr:hypothetical protein MG293_019392 [Ovis ammon polii]KAI4550805.1 hypothetical protein MJT46_018312 [Ovis ammon polii x Ovis aries]KAI4557835.1 hypothetical protein MJG53_018588 [Ovis ammon polii x Ovis aries]
MGNYGTLGELKSLHFILNSVCYWRVTEPKASSNFTHEEQFLFLGLGTFQKDETVSNTSDMAETKSMFREVLPKQGQLYVEDITTMVLCKPKLLPLKSLTLEKLEKMQQAAQDTIRQQEMTEKEQKITH